MNKFINKGASHYFRDSSDFRIPTEPEYKKIQQLTNRFRVSYSQIRDKFDNEKARNKSVYNVPQDNMDVLYYDVPSGKERIHPTQKPVALCERLIRTYSNVGDVILDNCMGSGSTAIASINTERRFIGFEKDAGFYSTAMQRYADHTAQERMKL